MNCLDAAIRFNQHCPKGSVVDVVLKSGERRRMKTAGQAFVWAGLALVELEGAVGPYQIEHVQPARDVVPSPADDSQAAQAESKVA